MKYEATLNVNGTGIVYFYTESESFYLAYMKIKSDYEESIYKDEIYSILSLNEVEKPITFDNEDVDLLSVALRIQNIEIKKVLLEKVLKTDLFLKRKGIETTIKDVLKL